MDTTAAEIKDDEPLATPFPDPLGLQHDTPLVTDDGPVIPRFMQPDLPSVTPIRIGVGEGAGAGAAAELMAHYDD